MSSDSTHPGRRTAPNRRPVPAGSSGRPGNPVARQGKPAGRPPASGERAAGRSRPRRPAGRLRLGRIDGRLSVAVIALLVVMSLFGVRLFQLQILRGSAYANAALLDRLRPVTLPAARGEITDDTGVPLATTVAAYDITADPTITGTYAAQLARSLAVPLAMTVPALQALLTPRNATNRYVILAHQVSPATQKEIDTLVAALEEKVSAADRNAAPVGGIYADSDPKRVYPSGNVAGNVVGFVSADGQALAGLEVSQNSLLAGKAGSSTREFAYGHVIPFGVNNTTPAVQGRSIRLTINRDLQYYVQSQVSAAVAANKAQFGMAIVMDIKTMQVKAMVSVPTLNPSSFATENPAILGNRSVDFAYEPGSVEKLLTMATLFDQGVANPHTPVTVPPTLTVDGVTIHDDVPHGTEYLTAAGVVAKSSNIGAAVLSSRLSAATLRRYLASFGYGSTTGIGLNGESNGILPKLSDWKGYTKPEIAYGQSVSVTSLQMAAAVASLFNGGVYRAPSIIAGTTDAQGVFQPAAAQPAHRVVSARAAAEVVNEAEMVVSSEGTAPNAAIPGYVVAGKTGTAQYSDPARGGKYDGYTTSFIGTAPADNPRYLVYVVIQKPKVGQTGSSTAAPAWRQIMTYLLATEHLSPTGAKPARLPLTTAAGG